MKTLNIKTLKQSTMIESIIAIIFIVFIISACCSSVDNTSTNNKTVKRTSSPPPRKTTYYEDYSFCECPSCGAPYYDGYCEECGYPDVNQGWLGEEYG